MIDVLNKKITKHFRWYYDNGYITARDGNAAYDAGTDYVVTASGAIKHSLNMGDFVTISKDGKQVINSLWDRKPSIESTAHLEAMKRSGKKASVHVHSPNTVALSALFESNSRSRFSPSTHHLKEALNSKWPELFRYTSVGGVVPFLEPGSKKLHESIITCLSYWGLIENGKDENGDPDINEGYAFHDIVIMQRHGVLSIGNTLDECMEHIVRLEHISGILLKIITASGGNLESIL